MTNTQLKALIDADITDKIAAQSLDNVDLGNDMKATVDYIDQEVTTLSDSLGAVATSNSFNDLDDVPAFGAVATSNDYNDLDNLPTGNANIYKAIITQSSTSAPVVNNILGTNTIGSIVWTRVSTGLYNGTLSGAFNNQKTFLQICPISVGIDYSIYQVDSNTVQIKTWDNQTAAFLDGGLNKTSILIEVYP